MDIKVLNDFAVVYECGSINRAARELFISPQGLSKSISKLEAETGIPLFMRTYEGMVPTAYAQELYVEVKRLQDSLASLRERASSSSRARVLRVAMISGQLSYLGKGFISSFEEAFPDVELRVEDATNHRANDLAATGKVDTAIVAGPVDGRSFSSTPLFSVPHVLMVGAGYPLAAGRNVSFDSLDGEVLVCLGDDYPVFSRLERRLNAAGARPRKIIKAAVPETLFPLVAAGELLLVGVGDGIFDQERPGIRCMPFADETFNWDVYLVRSSRSAPNRTVDEFWEFTTAWVRAHGSPGVNHVVDEDPNDRLSQP